VVRAGQGRLEDAASAFAAVLAVDPGNADAALNLGVVLQEQGDPAGAVTVLAEAVRRHPRSARVRVNLGNALKRLGRPDQAEGHFREAVALLPDDDAVWGARLLCSLYLPDRTPDEVLALHRTWGRRHPARPAPPPADPDPERVLRVGYLSPDLREHPVASFLLPILAHHDRSRVHATCYANVARPDAVTGRLKALCPAWHDVRGLTDAQVAAQVRADRIDILMDLGGHTAASRLTVLAHRPAPLQGIYLGYPATTGLEAVDFRLTDAVADPPGTERWYTERLVRIDGAFCCFVPPEGAPDPGPSPAATAGHVTFGSQSNPVKLNDGVLALWAEVLAAVPDARLLLAGGGYASAAVRGRFLDAFTRGGVAARVDFSPEAALPKTDFLARYRRMDVSLDSFPYAGHTTTCESLWMGVPVITLAGAWYIQRVGASLLTAAGLSEWIAGDPAQYVARAAALARDVGRLAELRATLRPRVAASPLMDGRGFTARLEAALRDLWRGACAGRGEGP
jgi:protein O-GlcNAc transferase